jgi:transcriptional regulator with XRE-family HTH domain
VDVNPIITAWLTRPGGVAPTLRALRAKAGLSQTALARAGGKGWSQPKVSRLEAGTQRPTEADIRTWADACGDVSSADPLVAQLEELKALRIGHKGRERHGLASLQVPYIEMVDKSSFICQVDVTFIPGLLQTADYARHLLTKLDKLDPRRAPETAEDIERAVMVRVRRQQGLYNEAKRFEFIVAEAVLRYVLVPVDVMLEQLARLQNVTDLSNVRLGIIPFGVELETAPQNKFEVYDDLVIVESFTDDTVPNDEDTELYLHLLGALWAEALEGPDARTLIRKAANDLRG